MDAKTWQEIAKEAQTHRNVSFRKIQPAIPEVPSDLPTNVTGIPKELLSKREIEITEKLPEQLVVELASAKLSSVELITAFIRRAAIASKLTNCVTEVLPERALARAKYCDEYLAQHKTTIGPLHGLPISVKEHISMKGLGLNCGFVGWWDRVGTEDAHVLRLLWNAGAVFYARTTEPQLLMHLETASNLYGETVCPYNRNLTSGGSSGGEGALIGMRGSCLGIGTDIGGSIRSPAANNGIWGFRPSSYRMSNSGAAAPMAGYEQIVPVLGPLSTSFEGLRLFMQTVIDQKPWLVEPSLIPMPWNYPPKGPSLLTKPDGSRKLKIGIMWHDNVVKPHPPVTRALTLLTSKLSSNPDIELTDWQPYKHDLAWTIISSLYFPDGGNEDKEVIALTNEPLLPLSNFILDQPTVKELTIAELWSRTSQREQYRTSHAAHWNSTGDPPVDVILCPVGPGVAPPLTTARYWPYTSQWNLLDYPALVFPVTTVSQTLDLADPTYKAMNDQDEANWALYTGPERFRDAPVCLQLVARRYEDEKLFEAMEVIKGWAGL